MFFHFFFFFSFFSNLVFASFLSLSFSSKFSSGVTPLPLPLPSDEVQALREIGKTLGKMDWNFSVDPCSGKAGWVTNTTGDYTNNVTCDYNMDVVPHVVSITLKRQNLSGTLPPELVKLRYLQNMHLTSNYLSGDLPNTLANLISLKELMISDNNFSGNIPDYIQNWPNLQRLYMQASGLNGPIPSSIASLVNLSELRLSDMKGIQQRFPPLKYNMTNMKYLILRSCNINDTLPDYLPEMSPEKLKVFDLSFNNLHGNIPERYNTSLTKMDYFYLTGNLLTGVVPDGMSAKSDYIDLSYNNFTVGSSGSCQEGNMNVFEKSLLANNSGAVSCFKTPICHNRLSHEFHINCGGDGITIGNTTYEADTNPGGPSNFFKSETNWGFSNTGHFMDTHENYYTFKSESMNNSKLYNSAWLSPLSLTYYGFCLQNGNYTVKLHFAEIVFSDDKTYNSLGRRLFDIYIQGRLVKKDFNIAAEANGVNKPIVKEFAANIVTNNSLDIRLYENYKPKTHVLTIVEVSVAIGVLFMILAILSIFLWKRNIRRRNIITEDLKGLHQQTGTFTLRQIKAATDNFNAANKIGEGGFGPVYKGLVSDGTVIAVKQLSSKSNQGNREFVNEVGMISSLQNPYLVKLYGCCIEGNQLLLVYEYLENNSLARALFGPEEHQLKLDWPTRHKICVGIAKGLAYLHEESRLKIVHRDIKATNVLLDKDLNAKISDFGLAKLDDEDNTHISTRIAGTYGYMAPEYAMKGYLTDKADVYSFGIVVLEIVSGRSNVSRRTEGGCFNLLDWVLVLKERDCLMELVDPRLGPDLNMKDMMDMVNLALLCINITPAMRPNMSTVVSMLEGKCAIPDPVSDSSSYSHDIAMKLREMRKHFEVNEEQSNNGGSNYFQNVSSSTGAPSTTSSSSIADLYPINLDSYYWQKRD